MWQVECNRASWAAHLAMTASLELSCVTSPKELAFAPLVHAAGYSFAWRNPKGKVLLERKKKLHLTSCALADIASVL